MHSAPEPQYATYDGDIGAVYFDQRLQPATVNGSNWTFRIGTHNYSAVNFTVTANRVFASLTQDITPRPTGQWVTYNPPPLDVVGTNGLPVEKFVAYPVVVLP